MADVTRRGDQWTKLAKSAKGCAAQRHPPVHCRGGTDATRAYRPVNPVRRRSSPFDLYVEELLPRRLVKLGPMLQSQWAHRMRPRSRAGVSASPFDPRAGDISTVQREVWIYDFAGAKARPKPPQHKKGHRAHRLPRRNEFAYFSDAVLTGAQTKVVKTPFRAPDANAHAERWVRSVTEECLDHLVLFGLGSLRHALRIYQDFFNGHRPHQGIGNQIPARQATGESNQTCDLPEGELTVGCEPFLGGLLNSYYRKAA